MGRPYEFADSMMCAIALWKATRGGSYRDCWGSLKETFGKSRTPHYVTMWRMMGNRMPIFEHDPKFTIKDGVMRVVMDSTGIANSNRGEWIRVKWNVKR